MEPKLFKMNTNPCFFLFSLILLAACKELPKEESHVQMRIEKEFRIEIVKDEALKILDPNTTIDVLAGGFQWTEGPLWIEEGKYLLFSDIPRNSVYKVDSKNETTLYLAKSGYSGSGAYGKEPGSNGLLLNKQGELVLLQHGDRRIVKMKASLNAPLADFEVLADNYMGKKFNSPNDAVYDSAGNLYFTDPPYGLPLGIDDPTKELNFQGVFCLMNTGRLVLLDSLSRPNGIALSVDEATLYVAVSDEKHAVWYAYDVPEAGQVYNRRIFYDATHLIGRQGEQGLPDGMLVNSKDYIFATGPGGVWVFNKEAEVIAKIHTGQATSNCTLSPDEKMLYITADDYVLGMALK